MTNPRDKVRENDSLGDLFSCSHLSFHNGGIGRDIQGTSVFIVRKSIAYQPQMQDRQFLAVIGDEEYLVQCPALVDLQANLRPLQLRHRASACRYRGMYCNTFTASCQREQTGILMLVVGLARHRPAGFPAKLPRRRFQNRDLGD